MTIISELSVGHFRNLQEQSIRPAAGLNSLVGENGAGKTSLLEAIHLLASGRSFRTSQVTDLIRSGSDCAQVMARVSAADRNHVLGIARCRNGMKLRHNGADVPRMSDLVRHLPVMALHPQSDDLVIGAPELRRRYLDRAAFYLDDAFAESHRQFLRALRQRNAALKANLTTEPWDPVFIEAGHQIEAQRRAALAGIEPFLPELATQLGPDLAISLSYEPGYRQDESLAEALARSRHREQALGSTLYGPHRADVRIALNGMEAKATASRGQIKVTTSVLILAVLALWRTARNRHAVVLYDDLPSELDDQHLDRLLGHLAEMGHQAFLTTVGNPALEARAERRFTVHEGIIQELVY